jgi:hypothetical protein
MAIPPKVRACVSVYPLLLLWMALVCPAAGQAPQEKNSTAPETGWVARPGITEVHSAQLPEKYRNAPKALAPEPPSMRYASLREHAPPRIVLPALDVTPYLEEDRKARKQRMHRTRIGVMRSVSITPDRDGEWSEPEAGVHIWRVEVQSPGAKMLKLRLDKVLLSEETELYIYAGNEIEMFRSGDISASKTVFSTLLTSDSARVELMQRSTPATSSPVAISGIGHLYRAPGEIADQDGACEIDASCHPDWSDTGNAVGIMTGVDFEGVYQCSGAMINSNRGDFSPLFLTAHHCFVSPDVGPSISIRWFYKTSSCGGELLPTLISNGSAFLADSLESDTTLIEPLGTLPDGITWAGWSIDGQSGAITGLHHPMGAPLRISFGNIISPDPTAPEFHRVSWDSGVTEPGSSGSPLLNSSHLIIGELQGGFSSCTAAHDPDYYGRLAVAYPHFIDANGNNYLINGLGEDHFGYIDTRDKAASIQPGSFPNLVLRYAHDDWFTLPATPQYYWLDIEAEDANMELYRNSEVTPFLSQTTGHGPIHYISQNGSDTFALRLFNPHGRSTTSYNLNVTVSVPVAPFLLVRPLVQPRSMSDFAYLGNISPDGGTGEWWFEYSPNADMSGASSSPHHAYTSSGGPNSGQNFDVSYIPPGGFQEDTTYYYRVAASDGVNNVHSQTGSFHTISGQLTLSAAQMNFPETHLGSNSVALPLTVINTGQKTLTFNFGVGFQYKYTTDCGASLAPNASCTVQIVFAPVLVGNSNGVANFDSSAGATQVALNGSGRGGLPSYSPLVVNLVSVIGRSITAMATVTNVGNDSLDGTQIQVTSRYSQVNDCTSAISPGAKCHIWISTTPGQVGGLPGGTLHVGPAGFGDVMFMHSSGVDFALNLPRTSRSSRAGALSHAILPGQSEVYQVSVSPSSPVSASAAMSCSGLTGGMSCSVQPSLVDLSGGAQDVNLTVTMPAKSQTLTTPQMKSRSLRVRSVSAGEAQARTVNVTVTAKLGGAIRTVVVPVAVEE